MIVTTTVDYARVGGHVAVRGDVVEDLRLGRLYAEAGFPVAILAGARTSPSGCMARDCFRSCAAA